MAAMGKIGRELGLRVGAPCVLHTFSNAFITTTNLTREKASLGTLQVPARHLAPLATPALPGAPGHLHASHKFRNSHPRRSGSTNSSLKTWHLYGMSSYLEQMRAATKGSRANKIMGFVWATTDINYNTNFVRGDTLV